MRDLLISFLAVFVLAMVPGTGGVFAQTAATDRPCALPEYHTDVRPDPAGKPTVVKVGMRVADLLEINDVNQTISVDVALRMQWTDPRLAAWEGCRLPIDSVWFPELIMKNSGRIFSRWPEKVSVEEGGRVTYLQRHSGTFASYHKLSDFPFDKQVITLRFFPLDWSIEKLVFEVDETFTGLAPLLNISDWQIKGVEAVLAASEFEATQQTRATFDLNISAQRYLGYYLWKILLPIALIVVMSWCVFWIQPTEFGTQIGLSATSVLTMIAFIFATTNMLPRLGYFTMLDRYVAWATVFVFLALLQSLITGFLASRGRVELAHRIDLASRFAFPVAFGLICLTFYTRVL